MQPRSRRRAGRRTQDKPLMRSNRRSDQAAPGVTLDDHPGYAAANSMSRVPAVVVDPRAPGRARAGTRRAFVGWTSQRGRSHEMGHARRGPVDTRSSPTSEPGLGGSPAGGRRVAGAAPDRPRRGGRSSRMASAAAGQNVLWGKRNRDLEGVDRDDLAATPGVLVQARSVGSRKRPSGSVGASNECSSRAGCRRAGPGRARSGP